MLSGQGALATEKMILVGSLPSEFTLQTESSDSLPDVKSRIVRAGSEHSVSKMLRNLHLEQNQFVAPEIIIDAAKKQYRIAECPITITKRFTGVSKKGTNWHYGFNFLRSIVKTWLR